MLSRPGEAIYNDANGAPEGNHFFQVVWLSDERARSYLKQIHDLARERRARPAADADRLRGGRAGRPGAQSPAPPAARRCRPGPSRRVRPRPGSATPVAIKDPTSALFRRQGGNHLLIVGQNDEAALGVMAAAHRQPGGPVPARGRPTASAQGHASSCSTARPKIIPKPECSAASPRLAARRRGRRLARRARRSSPRWPASWPAPPGAEAGDGPELFLFIHDLPRFRDLRRREDDFSFSRRKEEDASPADHLDAILREGPGLGVHVDHLVRHRQQPEPLLHAPELCASSRCACSSR